MYIHTHMHIHNHVHIHKHEHIHINIHIQIHIHKHVCDVVYLCLLGWSRCDASAQLPRSFRAASARLPRFSVHHFRKTQQINKKNVSQARSAQTYIYIYICIYIRNVPQVRSASHIHIHMHIHVHIHRPFGVDVRTN